MQRIDTININSIALQPRAPDVSPTRGIDPRDVVYLANAWVQNVQLLPTKRTDFKEGVRRRDDVKWHVRNALSEQETTEYLLFGLLSAHSPASRKWCALDVLDENRLQGGGGGSFVGPTPSKRAPVTETPSPEMGGSDRAFRVPQTQKESPWCESLRYVSRESKRKIVVDKGVLAALPPIFKPAQLLRTARLFGLGHRNSLSKTLRRHFF